MNEETRRMILAIMLCFLVMMGWRWYMGQKQPQQPAQPVPVSTERQTAPAQQAAQTTDAEQSGETASGQWHLLPAAQPGSQVVFGDRNYREGGYKAQITIDPETASLQDVLLSEFKWKVDDQENGYPLIASSWQRGQQRQSLMLGRMKLADRAEAFDFSKSCWQEEEHRLEGSGGAQSAGYQATIADSQGQPVLRVHKRYQYQPEDYVLELEVRFENQGSEPIKLDSLELYGPMGLLREDPRMDRRNMANAYVDLQGEMVVKRTTLQKLQTKPDKAVKELERPVDSTLQWVATSNKFFAASLEPVAEGSLVRTLLASGDVQGISMQTLAGGDQEVSQDCLATLLQLRSDQTIAPGTTETMKFRMYLGPIDKQIFDGPEYIALHYEKLIYRQSCSICTFDWLTYLLLKMMRGTYQIVGNYGVAIILLVLMVRLVLHPITKKSQVSMMGMSKMAPQAEEIRKKYANNKEEMNKQIMQLYKKQGATPILGCLPMFLQMPIWVALFTAVDANIALRHQGLLPASWHWLTDLSAPDRLIPFSVFGVTAPIQLPLLGGVDAINLLPILLCIAMTLQMKYSPQSSMSTGANPQMAQQQKIMMYMMPFMMLIFFYSAPSGLNLYIMASTFGGLIEQYFIRKHIRQKEAEEQAVVTEVSTRMSSRIGPKKKKPKPPVRFN